MRNITLSQNDLVLRQMTGKDAHLLFQLTDKNRQYLRQWLPWLDAIQDADNSVSFIASSLKKYKEKTALDLGVFFQGSLVGVIGFHDINFSNRKASIGYWLDADHQGKGLMTTACKLIIHYGFTELGLNRIEIKCAPGNEKSAAIPLRLGFKKEGILRENEWLYDHFVDHEIYSLLSEEWNQDIR